MMVDMTAQFSTPVRLWMYWLFLMLFLTPVFFFKYKAARVLLSVQLVNLIIAGSVFILSGGIITRLLGLGHVLWLIPAYVILRELRGSPPKAYRVFMILALMTICISLVFDFRDYALWIMGDRGSILPPTPLYRALS